MTYGELFIGGVILAAVALDLVVFRRWQRRIERLETELDDARAFLRKAESRIAKLEGRA